MENNTISFILSSNLKRWREKILFAFGSGKSYPSGYVFSNSGEVGPFTYYLLDGVVKVYTRNPNGYNRLVGYHQKDTIFALDCCRGSEIATVSTEAVTSCQVIKITAEELKELCQKEPEFCYEFMLFEQDVLRLMCYNAEIQTSATVTSRLASFLLLFMQSEEYRRLGHINLSQDNIASIVNASRIQVARVQEKMQDEGMIKIGRKKLWVLNRARLKYFSENAHLNI